MEEVVKELWWHPKCLPLPFSMKTSMSSPSLPLELKGEGRLSWLS
jgi:hypothetical protein